MQPESRAFVSPGFYSKHRFCHSDGTDEAAHVPNARLAENSECENYPGSGTLD
jgi:hypothetical protein